MARSITEFLSNFTGGARANLYFVTISPGAGSSVANNSLLTGGVADSITFHAKGAQLPESAVGEIIVPYLGRQVKLPGDRTYADWNLTVLSDEAMKLRNVFEQWNADINGHTSNRPNGYQYGWVTSSIVTVAHLTRQGETTHEYKLTGAFPKDVGSVDVAYDNNDSIMEFPVTFAYTYHEITNKYANTFVGPPEPSP